MSSDFLDLMASRHCIRAFVDKPVPQAVLERVLSAAQQAPSSKNTQSWQVVVVTGAARDALSAALCEAYDANTPPAPDYEYMSEPMDDVFKSRARACGFALFELKGIERDDKAGRVAHGRENFTFFGAPVQMLFHLPQGADPGMYLDMGLYMQSVMLGLQAEGVGSCPQFSVASYPDIVRECLGLGEDRLIVSGMSVGYADEKAKVNTFVPKRVELGEVVTWKGEW